MSQLIRASLVTGVMVCLPLAHAAAGDKDKFATKARPSPTKADGSQKKTEHLAPEINLLDAARDGLISLEAQGRGDGRMTLSVTNRTRKPWWMPSSHNGAAGLWWLAACRKAILRFASAPI